MHCGLHITVASTQTCSKLLTASRIIHACCLSIAPFDMSSFKIHSFALTSSPPSSSPSSIKLFRLTSSSGRQKYTRLYLVTLPCSPGGVQNLTGHIHGLAISNQMATPYDHRQRSMSLDSAVHHSTHNTPHLVHFWVIVRRSILWYISLRGVACCAVMHMVAAVCSSCFTLLIPSLGFSPVLLCCDPFGIDSTGLVKRSHQVTDENSPFHASNLPPLCASNCPLRHLLATEGLYHYFCGFVAA